MSFRLYATFFRLIDLLQCGCIPEHAVGEYPVHDLPGRNTEQSHKFVLRPSLFFFMIPLLPSGHCMLLFSLHIASID